MNLRKLVLLRACLLTTAFSAVTLAKSSISPLELSFQKLKGSNFENARPVDDISDYVIKRDEAVNGSGDDLTELKNQHYFYSVEMHIGTPPQSIILLLDTGSSDMWVVAETNPYCKSNAGVSEPVKRQIKDKRQLVNTEASSEYSDPTPTSTAIPFNTTVITSIPSSEATIDCSEFHTFDPDASSSFESNGTLFLIGYGDNSVAVGSWGMDSIKLEDVSVDGLTFGVGFSTNSSTGVLGVGLRQSETTRTGYLSSVVRPFEYDNLPIVLKNNGHIKKVAYSLYLNQLDAADGSILFGAVDHSKYQGQLYTVPMVIDPINSGLDEVADFSVSLNGIGLITDKNGTERITFSQTAYPALLDSGTTYSLLPPELISAIYTYFDPTFSAMDNETALADFTIPCKSVEGDYEFVFDFSGIQITAPIKNFIEDYGNGICTFTLQSSGENAATLGDNFLTNAYVVYNLEDLEISLAQADYSKKESDIEIIVSTVPGAERAAGATTTWSSQQAFSTGGNIFTTNSTTTTTSSSSTSSSSSSSDSGSSKSNQGTSVTVPLSLVFGSFSLVLFSVIIGHSALLN